MTPNEICATVKERLNSIHTGCFRDMDKPLLLISEEYPGVWLEHVYDAVFYAQMDKSKLYLAENTIRLFIEKQRPDGQLPFGIFDGNKIDRPPERLVGYSQIQECVSFARLCYMVYEMNSDRDFLRLIYSASRRWRDWLATHRMTSGRGLIEMFSGFDTGHDNSSRLDGMRYRGNRTMPDGTRLNAGEPPTDDGVCPILAVDMSCNYYGTLISLSRMARALGLTDEAEGWLIEAKEVKARLFELCFDEGDCFFYDVDKNGNKRKYLSSTIFHLFMEEVLDEVDDADLIREIYERHILNEKEFRTPYPYPSMAISDPSVEGHMDRNCWGYFTQGLIALRCTLWMDKYGFGDEFDRLCHSWVGAWTEHYDTVKMGQELDPITGVPTECSEWYSSTMLFYIYAARRIGLATE